MNDIEKYIEAIKSGKEIVGKWIKIWYDIIDSGLKNGVITKDSIPWEANNVFRVTEADTFTILVDNEEVITLNFEECTFESAPTLTSRTRNKRKVNVNA